jgi:hypothetical protein
MNIMAGLVSSMFTVRLKKTLIFYTKLWLKMFSMRRHNLSARYLIPQKEHRQSKVLEDRKLLDMCNPIIIHETPEPPIINTNNL